ncbi:MAG: family 16 glycoside hydrolase [bacterium]
MENPLDYVVSLSRLIKQKESRQALKIDLFFVFIALFISIILLTILDIKVPDIIFYTTGLILITYLILLIRWVIEQLTITFSISHHYKWSLENYLKDWTFQGILKIDKINQCLILTDSDAGCIIKNKSWKNFEMTFEFNAANEHGFGLIYHAKENDNYLMFKIQTNQKIVPHYRNKDGWQILLQGISDEVVKNIENKWNIGNIVVTGREVFLKINDQEFFYNIPDNVIINHITNLKNALNNPLIVPVTCSEGSIGFRAHSEEKLLFRNIKICQRRAPEGRNEKSLAF